MANLIGLDPDIVQGAARQLASESSNLDQLSGRVERLVWQAQSSWKGPDADAFARTWQGTLRGQVKSASSLLAVMAKTLNTNVQQQIETSNGKSTSGGGSGTNTEHSYATDDGLYTADEVTVRAFTESSGLKQLAGLGVLVSIIQMLDRNGRPPSGINVLQTAGDGMSVIGDTAEWLQMATNVTKGLGIAGIVTNALAGGAQVYSDIKNQQYAAAGYDFLHTAAVTAGSALLMTPAAPVGLVILGATAVTDIARGLYENAPAIKNAVDTTVKNAAKIAVDTARLAADAVVHPVETAVKVTTAVTSAVSSGWKTLTGWFGF